MTSYDESKLPKCGLCGQPMYPNWRHSCPDREKYTSSSSSSRGEGCPFCNWPYSSTPMKGWRECSSCRHTWRVYTTTCSQCGLQFFVSETNYWTLHSDDIRGSRCK